MKKLLLAILLIVFFLPANASAITYPKSVNYLKAKFVLSGEVSFSSFSNSIFKKAYIYVYIPQDDGRQKVQLLSVQPSTYEIVEDEYGNNQVKLIIPEFREKVTYKIETLVEVREGYSKDNISFVEETLLTKPTQEILSKALEIGGNSLDKLAELAIWVNNYVQYDRALEAEIKSASWVFENRKGTCDEFSTLFISLTRAWKIPFRYVSGVAYSDKFERHGWVELLINDTWIPFDPTWALANYLDATHIKIASLPDANFSEKIEVEGRNIVMDWVKPTSYEIEILDSKEESPIEVRTNLITKEIGGGYFLLEGEIIPKTCLIATLRLTSCLLDGEGVFDIFDEKDLWVCKDKKTYWVGRVAKELRKEYIYTCPLTLNTDFGKFATETIKIEPRKEVKGIKIFPEKIITTPNTSFEILVDTNLQYYYLLYLDKVNETKEKRLYLHSPKVEGNYKIFSIGLDGSGDYSELSILKQKFVKILEIEAPKNFTKGKYYLVNVSVQNIGNKSLEGRLSLIFDEKTFMEEISFLPNEILKKSFNLSFEEIGRKEIRVILDVIEDKDVKFFEIEVVEEKPEFFGIINFLIDLFKKLINFLQSLIKIS